MQHYLKRLKLAPLHRVAFLGGKYDIYKRVFRIHHDIVRKYAHRYND